MNKLKFIPILAAVALLSACEAKAGARLKAPKFAKEGEECEAEVAFDKITDGLDNLDTRDSKFIGSKVASYYNALKQFSPSIEMDNSLKNILKQTPMK